MPQKPKVWTVLSMLEWATDYFQSKKIPDARLSIEWILAEVLGVRRLDLYLNYDRPLSGEELDRLRPMVRRRGEHEPLQYIIGYTLFMGCRIDVGPEVLIPRAETEQLVEIILQDQRLQDQSAEKEKEPADKSLRVLDIGTGSGCIPVALGKSGVRWQCTAVDNSAAALQLAERNARNNQVGIEFLNADLFHLDKNRDLENRRFDVIVSNPPYVLPEERETLERQVVDFEPENALFHDNPVEIYRVIGKFAFTCMPAGGRLYLECSHLLSGRIRDILEPTFSDVEVLKDYDNRDRFIRAEKTG